MSNDAAFSVAQRAWRALSEEDRMTWRRVAELTTTRNRVGLERHPTAYNLYVGVAMRNVLLGLVPPTNVYRFGLEDLGQVPAIEIWPGGPANVIHLLPYFMATPRCTIRGQRLFRSDSGLPGQLWQTVDREAPENYAFNFWAELTAKLGVPSALEWFRFRVTQWVTGYPRTFVTEHLVQIPNVGPELVYNGDFQIGGSPPSGWLVGGTGVLWQTGAATYGDGESGRWTVAAAQPLTYWDTAVAKRFSLVGGASYTLRFVCKFEVGVVSLVRVHGTGMTTVVLYTNLSGSHDVWERHEASFTPDGNATGCYLLFYNSAGIAVDVYVDNISIRKDTP